MIDQSSDRIVDLQIVQVSEVTSSNAMREKDLKGALYTSSSKQNACSAEQLDGY